MTTVLLDSWTTQTHDGTRWCESGGGPDEHSARVLARVMHSRGHRVRLTQTTRIVVAESRIRSTA